MKKASIKATPARPNPLSKKVENPQSPHSSPNPQHQNDSKTMEIDEEKEKVDVEAILEDKSAKIQKSSLLDLDEDQKKRKKPKKDLFEDSNVIRDVKLNGNIHVRLLSTIEGYFVDLRRYNGLNPTKVGLMMAANKFAIAAEVLTKDIKEVIPQIK